MRYFKEIWKPVVGYEGLYEVSNWGRVASLNYRNTGKRKILKQRDNTNGYLIVHLCNYCSQITAKVHRLVAQAFPAICGTYFEGAEIDHIDGNRYNNIPENLRWCTTKENANNPNKKHSPNSNSHKLKVYQLNKSGGIIAEYESINEASRISGAINSSISRCCKGKLNSAGGFIWKFAC